MSGPSVVRASPRSVTTLRSWTSISRACPCFRRARPFMEPGLDELVARCRAKGSLSFQIDPAIALPDAEVVLLCVNTDGGPDGSVDLSAIEAAVRAICTFQPGRCPGQSQHGAGRYGRLHRVAD